MGDSGSINYTQNSGSYWLARNDDYLFGASASVKGRFRQRKPNFENLNTAKFRSHLIFGDVGNTKGRFPQRRNTIIWNANASGSGPGTTCSRLYTYYQRVYASGLAEWCYYAKTTIDPTPLSDETTPPWVGALSDHSVLYVTSEIVCS